MNKIAAAILCLCLCLFASCKDRDKEPMLTACEQIEGVWRGVDYPKNVYSFSDGTAWTKFVSFGVIITHIDYAYTCEGDTITLVNIVSGARSRMAVSFPTDSTAVMGDKVRIEIVKFK